MAELEYLQVVFQLAVSSVTRLLVLLRIYYIASVDAPLSQAPKPSFTYALCDLFCAKRCCAPKWARWRYRTFGFERHIKTEAWDLHAETRRMAQKRQPTMQQKSAMNMVHVGSLLACGPLNLPRRLAHDWSQRHHGTTTARAELQLKSALWETRMKRIKCADVVVKAVRHSPVHLSPKKDSKWSRHPRTWSSA